MFCTKTQPRIGRIRPRGTQRKNGRHITMKTITKNTGIKVNAGVKAGGLPPNCNHSRGGLKVKANVKAGSLVGARNHCTRGLTVKASIKAGSLVGARNHSARMVALA